MKTLATRSQRPERALEVEYIVGFKELFRLHHASPCVRVEDALEHLSSHQPSWTSRFEKMDCPLRCKGPLGCQKDLDGDFRMAYHGKPRNQAAREV